MEIVVYPLFFKVELAETSYCARGTAAGVMAETRSMFMPPKRLGRSSPAKARPPKEIGSVGNGVGVP
jgi:hypothetical protein